MIIHQTLKDTNVPPHLKFCMDSWKTMNPECEYILWTDETARKYIEENYPKYIEGFDRASGIQKAGLLRILVVHGFGGVYADSDFECLRKIPFVIGDKLSVAYEPKGHDRRLCDAFFYAPKGCPELLKVAERGLQFVGSKCALELWGPACWDKALRGCDITIINSDDIYPIRDITLGKFPEDVKKVTTKNFGNAWAVHYWDHSNWQQHRWNMLSKFHRYVSPKRTLTELSVCAIFRNNQKYLETFFIPTFKNMEKMYPSIKFHYYLYENDSIDETPTLVTSLGGISEKLNKPTNKRDTSKTRLDAIAAARDRLLSQRPFKGEWCMFIDSDIIFSPNILSRFMAREIPDNTVGLSCNGKDSKQCKHHRGCRHYYDTLALRFKDGQSGFDHFMKNGFSCCPFSDKEDINKWMNNEPVETQSSYGGLTFYKTCEVNKPHVFYGECSEGVPDHIYFNQRIEGKIYADPTLQVIMFEHLPNKS